MERHPTKYPGVFYRNVKRISRSDTEKVFYAVFKKNGKTIEAKIGRQYADDMTPARANFIRMEMIEGRELTRSQKRQEKKLIPLTLSDIWEEYKRINHANKGMRTDDNRFNQHIGGSLGSKQIKNITIKDIDSFKLKLAECSPKTLKNTLELITRLSNFAIKKQLAPGLSFKIVYPSIDNHKMEDLSDEQLHKLLEVLHQEQNFDVRNIMMLALHTGLRRGEIFKLKWDDIDLQRNLINIVNPKSGRNQVIPLNDLAREIIEQCIRHKSEYIFPATRGGGPRKSIDRAARRIRAAAGIPDDFRPMYGLRHFFATALLCSGKVELHVLQKLLTHSSPQMTLRYAKIRDQVMADASNVISDVMKK